MGVATGRGVVIKEGAATEGGMATGTGAGVGNKVKRGRERGGMGARGVYGFGIEGE